MWALPIVTAKADHRRALRRDLRCRGLDTSVALRSSEQLRKKNALLAERAARLVPQASHSSGYGQAKKDPFLARFAIAASRTRLWLASGRGCRELIKDYPAITSLTQRCLSGKNESVCFALRKSAIPGDMRYRVPICSLPQYGQIPILFGNTCIVGSSSFFLPSVMTRDGAAQTGHLPFSS